MLLQKLTSKGFIKIENKRSQKQLNILFIPAATPILNELAAVQNNYDQARFTDFTDEELIQYAYFTEKIKQNTQKIL